MKSRKIYIILFIILYVFVALVSGIHGFAFFGLANVPLLAIMLAIAFEIGQAAVLFSILTDSSQRKKVMPWFLMGILTLVQVMGNVYNSYKYLITNAEENLRLLEDRINAEDLINDVGDVFGKNQGERINTVRDLTGNLENDLLDLIARGTDETGTIAPIDLQRIKQQVGEMTNWADTTRPKIQNKTLEQIYGKFNKRLIDISPELAMANKEYAKIKNFQNNEGLKRVLRPGDNIDSASTALKNYNTTVTKGNTSRNIQDLENA